jgi:hypothetical protein
MANVDGFVKSSISALRFISLPLRRTASTPRVTRFARLDISLFTKPSIRMTFNEFINFVFKKVALFWRERHLAVIEFAVSAVTRYELGRGFSQ